MLPGKVAQDKAHRVRYDFTNETHKVSDNMFS